MPAYLVIDTVVHDPTVYAEYLDKVRPIMAAYGGEPLVSSEKITPVSGGWEPKRMSILRFPDMAALKSCFGSEDYAAIKHLREASCSGRTVIVED